MNHLQLILLTFICIGSIFSDDLKIAFGESRAPFVYQEGDKWIGIEVDIVKSALKYRGHTVSNETHAPNKRLEVMLESGYDGVAGVQVIGDYAFYSDDFISYHNYAISRAQDNLVINKIEDLTNYVCVAWQNAHLNLGREYSIYYGPGAELYTNEDKYIEFAKQELQNKFFWAGRASVIIVDSAVFKWYQKQLSTRFDTYQELVYHDIFPKETFYKVKFKSKKIRDDFNYGLQKLKESGQYLKIISSYLN